MKIVKMNPSEPDAIYLMDELSQNLESITGASGRNSFNSNDVCVPRSVFVVAYDEGGQAIGCGGIRPISESIAEVKRMFAKTKGEGVGSEILFHLEKKAIEMGYVTLWVETRLVNECAVSFYKSRGYKQISNYGKYARNSEAICFEKRIS
ncbi:GNAT family N-acetyltransferase [Clostridium cibarium]|uniref:GNAT family N-acetyltransferase n=1 Tax=Clostridium cibarium TaxID=2762247 RepID=A0ABR8PQX9_9CLOT|nr:GNAT family N-acetyltransferase [Clostridium cibarium]MBD7910595.1 GNAT family N-acetyltransferase [Clostridium cibarium]